MTQYPIAEVRERLKALLEKATPEMRAGNLSGKRMANILRRGTPPNLASRFEPNVDEDGELIAEAVNALPALLTHLDAVEGENARLRAEVAELTDERDEAVNWSAIVDRHGTDRFDDLVDAWFAQVGVQRMFNAVASVFSKWSNDDLIGRFKEGMANITRQAFVEGALVGVRAEVGARGDALERLLTAESQLASQAASLAEMRPLMEATGWVADLQVRDYQHPPREKAVWLCAENPARQYNAADEVSPSDAPFIVAAVNFVRQALQNKAES